MTPSMLRASSRSGVQAQGAVSISCSRCGQHIAPLVDQAEAVVGVRVAPEIESNGVPQCIGGAPASYHPLEKAIPRLRNRYQRREPGRSGALILVDLPCLVAGHSIRKAQMIVGERVCGMLLEVFAMKTNRFSVVLESIKTAC